MCFKRIDSILWHQTSRFPGRSFPFVSPPRMLELITAKRHTLLARRFGRTQTQTHTTKRQPVKVAVLDRSSWVRSDDATQRRDETLRRLQQLHLHESKLIRRDKRPLLTAASRVSPLIDFLLSVSHRSTSANGAELCNIVQLWAFFFPPFPYKSLPALNSRRLKPSGTPDPCWKTRKWTLLLRERDERWNCPRGLCNERISDLPGVEGKEKCLEKRKAP